MERKQIAGMNQNYRQYSYDYCLDSLQRAGYESIELWLGAPHYWVDSQKWYGAKEILKKTKNAGINIVSVTTPSGGAFQYQYGAQEIFHMKRSIAYFKNGVRTAAELNAPVFTVNTGWGYWDDDPAEATRRTVEIVGEVCAEAEKLGLTVAMESLTKDESLTGFKIDQIEAIIHAVRSPVLKAMIDLCAIRFSRETSEQWFERFGDDLVHYHFQDGNLTTPSDGHYAWGVGEFPLVEELAVLKRHHYRGILTQEIYGSSDPRADDFRNMKALEPFLEN